MEWGIPGFLSRRSGRSRGFAGNPAPDMGSCYPHLLYRVQRWRREVSTPDDLPRNESRSHPLERARYWMLITARVRDGSTPRRGCIALAKSKDLRSWTVHSPLCKPYLVYAPECATSQRVSFAFLCRMGRPVSRAFIWQGGLDLGVVSCGEDSCEFVEPQIELLLPLPSVLKVDRD